MKKNYPAFLIILVAISTGLMSFTVLRVGGSPGAKTGSPGDGASCLECHSGTANNVSNWITSDIPETGYLPGEKYNLTATGTHSGVGRFGFELTAENTSNAKAGTFTINDDGTKLVNANAAVTHKSSGTLPSGDSRSWTTEWTAPAEGTGDVTFYAAFNAANGNGGTSGDVIYLTSLQVKEGTGSTGLFDNVSGKTIYPYPNPISDLMRIDLPAELVGDIVVEIYNINGQTIYSQRKNTSEGIIAVDMSGFDSGAYFIRLHSSNQDYFGRVVKK